MKTAAYIVQANRNEPIFLCVRDYAREVYHQFEIDDPLTLARLSAECSERLHVALGAVDMKEAGEAIAKELSRMWQKRGLPSG